MLIQKIYNSHLFHLSFCPTSHLIIIIQLILLFNPTASVIFHYKLIINSLILSKLSTS